MGYGIRNVAFGIWVLGYGIWDLGYAMYLLHFIQTKNKYACRKKKQLIYMFYDICLFSHNALFSFF